jgi:hypothetical protein
MEEKEKNKSQIEYDTYLEERKLLIEAKDDGSKQFDKGILTLSAGALAISITFINQISPHPKNCTLYLLSIAWISFIMSLLSTLISFLTSQEAYSRAIEILETEFFKDKPNSCNKNTYATLTKILNYTSAILFIIGVIFLVCFCMANLNPNRGGS